MRGDGARVIQAYIGDGKGKTSAAVGQSLRAAGHGYHVLFLQFLKNTQGVSGELRAFEHIPEIRYASFGTGRFLKQDDITDLDRGYARDAIDYATAQAEAYAMDVLVLDEIGVALEYGLVDVDRALRILEIGEGWLDTLLTGRRLPEILLEKADMTTNMILVRHHYNRGVTARRGIEY